jgi:hypothetical protein
LKESRGAWEKAQAEFEQLKLDIRRNAADSAVIRQQVRESTKQLQDLAKQRPKK